MTAEAEARQPFVHSGKFFDVLGLALKNAFFTIITLTLYRFWARTAMRRRVWSRVWFLGDPLEYTGTAWELFRGFLIALPCFFLPAIFILYIAPYVMDPTTAGWLLFGFYVLFVPLIAAARYWMRRYQLSRTRWRGIRMGLTGSAFAFAGANWFWGFLTMLSLGWYTPVARMKAAKMLWENARFGDMPFSFDDHADAKGLWWPFALSWFGVPLALFAAYFIAFVALFALGAEGLFFPQGEGAEPSADLALLPALMGLGVIALFFLFLLGFQAPYNAAAMNKIASLLSLDGARFKLRAKTFSLLGITLAGWLIVIFSLGLLAPIAGFLQVRYVIARLEMIGTPKFAEIGQSIIVAPRSGESIADAFDLDMGVGVI
ncbi:MAG: DUF898 family protein [Hyphomonadaceae bacterium]